MTDYTIASPNGGTWSIQSTNSATVGRFHDLAFFMEGAAGAGNVFKQCRPGVLVGPSAAAASNVPGAFAVAAGAGLNFTVQPGAALVERSTLVGPYLVESTAVGTGAVGTADPSLTRVDRLDLQVLDGVLGDNGGVSKTSVKVTAGTPGGGAAAAPINSIPLGSWSIPAGTTSLAATATWTPARKAAAIRGAARLLLEGDLASDPGFIPGEERVRFDATYGRLNDFWDASTSTWRGTAKIELTAAPGNVACSANAYNAIAAIAIADPGWPYKVKVSGQALYSAGANNIPFAWITLDSTVGNVGAITGTVTTVSNAADFALVLSPYTFPTVQTSTHTIRLIVDSNIAGTCFGSTAAIARSTWLNVEIVPA